MGRAVKWQGVAPGGQIITRTTARTYSHAVVGRRVMPGQPVPAWHVAGWCGRPDLAERMAARLRADMATYPEGVAEVALVEVAPAKWPGSTMTPEELDAAEVAAMAGTTAEMAADAVTRMAPAGDPVADLVRSCVDVLAGESFNVVADAVTVATHAQGSPSAYVNPAHLVALADAVARSLRFLAGMASDLIAGKYDLDTVEADQGSGCIGQDVYQALETLGDAIRAGEDARDEFDADQAAGVPVAAPSWDGPR